MKIVGTDALEVERAAAPSSRTIQRHFARLGLNARADGSAPTAFGRFEAEAPNVRWTGDAVRHEAP